MTVPASFSVTLVVAWAIKPLIRSPLAFEIPSDGIVIAGSPPPSPNVGPPLVFATTTAIAPWSWALCTFDVKVQTPRSMSATFPAGFAR
jgi:hypothetical protein